MNRRTQQEMEEIEEQEDDYVNASRGAVDKKRTRPGRRFFLLIAVCWWLILLAIMGLRIYLTSELSGNNAELYSRIQELETREKNLMRQIQNMKTNWNELNVSRAQWSIDSYCLGNTDKKCQRCQRGWLLIQLKEPSCIEINNPPSPGWKTWAEAQEDCRGKNSNLAVVHSVQANNTESYKGNTYWIGLRVVNKKWEWVDGSDLTDSSWIPVPVEGHCAVFYKGNYWYSESCEEKRQWNCKKKALSV